MQGVKNASLIQGGSSYQVGAQAHSESVQVAKVKLLLVGSRRIEPAGDDAPEAGISIGGPHVDVSHQGASLQGSMPQPRAQNCLIRVSGLGFRVLGFRIQGLGPRTPRGVSLNKGTSISSGPSVLAEDFAFC